MNKQALLRPGVSDKLLAKLIEAMKSRGVRSGPEFDFVRLAKRYLRQTTHSQIEVDSLIAALEEALPQSRRDAVGTSSGSGEENHHPGLDMIFDFEKREPLKLRQRQGKIIIFSG